MSARRLALSSITSDLRFAIRTLQHAPGFALAAVLTLALGIGATTAMFSVVDAALLRPLPYPEPDRLVAVFETMPGNDRRLVAPANFVDWRNESRTLTDLAGFYTSRRTIGSGAAPERVLSTSVSGNIFTTLGARAAVGRTFSAADDSAVERLAILSDGLWRRLFGGDPDIVGKAIRIDDEPYAVIGVMPADFRFPERTELFTLGTRGVPALRGAGPDVTSLRDVHYFRVIGRLRAGSSPEASLRELSSIAAGLQTRHPETNRDLGVNLVGLHDALSGNTRSTLLFLFGVVGLVLLLACTNVAGLTLARSGKRQREFAIRTAIGAKRGQLVRQVLVESTLLSVLGGASGIALATLAIDRLVAAAPIELPEVATVAIDARVLLFALLVSAATGVAFGLLPALQASTASSLGALRQGARGATGTRSRLRGALVVGELALSLTLLFGAGLLLKSFVGLLRVDPGFVPERVVTIDPALSRSAYAEAERIVDYYTRALERVSALPGVEAVGAVSVLPASGQRMNRGVHIEGRPVPARQTDQTIEYQAATPGYFAAMGIPMKAGRAFSESDDGRAAPIAIVNEEALRQYWPGIDPIGRRVGFGGPVPTWRTIVGVVGNVRQLGLDQPALPEVYVPLLQDPDRDMSIVVRTNIDPSTVTMALRRVMQDIDPSQPLMSPRLMTGQLAASLARPRFFSALLGGFAAAALLLATLGVYGVVATAAQARTREMGIRVALGAQRGEVLRLVLSGGAKLALAGIALGSAGALLFARAVRGLLVGVEPGDPMVFVATGALLGTAALLASWLPARRAAGADPMIALRND